MDRVVRLYQLWSWLPHFRAVAETEHLPTASEALGISSSSLSRALKQLEGALDRELFEREGRNIGLNHDGRRLLGAIRTAMRGIDDAVTDLLEDSTPLPLRVAAPGPLHAAVVLDVIETIRSEHERVAFELSSCSAGEMVSLLCRGDVDVCLHEGPVAHDDLVSVLLGQIDKRVACSSSHPLAGRGPLRADEIGDHPFASPPANARGIREDGWPIERERRIGLTVTHMRTGIDACLAGRFLTVLPTPVIRASDLEELEISDVEIPSAAMFATMRRGTGTRPREFDELLAGLETAFKAS